MHGISDRARSDNYLTILEQIDEIADRFETAWKSGGPPDIADYVAFVPPAIRHQLLTELIELDNSYRAQFGLAALSNGYWEQFADLMGNATVRDSNQKCGHDATTAPFPWLENYEILEELGSGGMGTVYKARQRRPNRLVAIKVLRGGVASNSREATRLLAEAEAIAQLQHLNIVQIYEVGQHEGFPFFSMELAEGGTLAGRIGGRPQPPHSIATIMATIARAIHYSHERGVIHRDLKPANVLLTGDGIPKISDFGLAKRLESPQGQTLPGTILGTPAYMAPEQAEGKSSELTPAVDTYALGVMLYEMLTGSPPFKGATPLDTLEQVRTCEPVPPSRLTPKVPRDLETICLKAMSKEPARRYSSTEALADDLSRFQRGEPILARPLGTLSRSWRWCRRKPAWAALAVTVALLVVAVIIGAVSVALVKTAHEKDRRREAIVQRLQLLRAGNHIDGWSAQAWDLVAQAGEIRNDPLLRNQAAASCEGLDARLERHIENERVSWIAFDPNGPRLLAGGRNDSQRLASTNAKLWDGFDAAPQVLAHAGAGPVVFRSNSAPLILLLDAGTLKLWGMDGKEPLSQFHVASHPGTTKTQLALNSAGLPLLALDAEGTVVAAGTEDSDKNGRVSVWETRSSSLLFQVPVHASALAISSGGSLIAAAQNERVLVWATRNGKQVAEMPLPHGIPRSIAFSPDERRLAVGDSAGTATIWNLRLMQPIAFCYGPPRGLHALAFSPDGTLLAGGGHASTIIWNAASGQAILRLRTEGLVTNLAFSVDAQRLAVSATSPGSIYLWQLDHNRGIGTLRGLVSPASSLCISADGTKLAAISSNREAAIWDLQRGRLLRLFDTPIGGPETEPAIALSADGNRFACSVGGTVRLWEVVGGNLLGSWRLPGSLGEALTFDPSGNLISFRAEPERSGTQMNGPSPLNQPCVCRVRNLTGQHAFKLLQEVASFNHRFFRAVASPDGRSFLAEGTSITSSGPVRTIKCFASDSGEERWSIQSKRTAMISELVFDSASESIAVQVDNQPGCRLLDVSNGEQRGYVEKLPVAMSASGSYWVAAASQSGSEQSFGFSVYRRGEKAPLITFGVDRAASGSPVFSADGARLAWANDDGTVSICTLDQLRSKLAQSNLEW